MESAAVLEARTNSGCSPRRTALGELYIPFQSGGAGWPLLGPDSASDIGPNARRWAENLQKQKAAHQPSGTVVVKTGQEAEQNQSQWNTWLEKGDSEDHSRNLSNASAAAQEPQDRPKKAPSGASRHRRTMAESELDFLAGFELPAASTVSSPRERQECVKNASPPTEPVMYEDAGTAVAVQSQPQQYGVDLDEGVSSDDIITELLADESVRESTSASQHSQGGIIRHSSIPADLNGSDSRLPEGQLSRSMTEDCEQLAQPYQESIHETVAEEEDVLHALPPGPSHHRNASGHKRRPSMGGPVYMRPPLHSRVPSADIGALNLHEYFSPLSIGLHNSFDPATPPQSQSSYLQPERNSSSQESSWQHYRAVDPGVDQTSYLQSQSQDNIIDQQNCRSQTLPLPSHLQRAHQAHAHASARPHSAEPARLENGDPIVSYKTIEDWVRTASLREPEGMYQSLPPAEPALKRPLLTKQPTVQFLSLSQALKSRPHGLWKGARHPVHSELQESPKSFSPLSDQMQIQSGIAEHLSLRSSLPAMHGDHPHPLYPSAFQAPFRGTDGDNRQEPLQDQWNQGMGNGFEVPTNEERQHVMEHVPPTLPQPAQGHLNPHDKEHNDYAFVPIAKDNAVSYSQVKAQRLLPSEEIMNIARRSNGSALIKALRPDGIALSMPQFPAGPGMDASCAVATSKRVPGEQAAMMSDDAEEARRFAALRQAMGKPEPKLPARPATHSSTPQGSDFQAASEAHGRQSLVDIASLPPVSQQSATCTTAAANPPTVRLSSTTPVKQFTSLQEELQSAVKARAAAASSVPSSEEPHPVQSSTKTGAIVSSSLISGEIRQVTASQLAPPLHQADLQKPGEPAEQHSQAPAKALQPPAAPPLPAKGGKQHFGKGPNTKPPPPPAPPKGQLTASKPSKTQQDLAAASLVSGHKDKALSHAQTGPVQNKTARNFGLGAISADDLATGISRLRKCSPNNATPSKFHKDTGEGLHEGNGGPAGADSQSEPQLHIQAGKGAEGAKVNKGAADHRSNKSQGGVMAALLKRAQDLRASFYPESNADTDSVHTSWDD